MAYQYETVDVKISRRVLWIGMHMIPLQNVTWVGHREDLRDRVSLTWTFLKRAGRTLGIGFVLLSFLACSMPSQLVPQLIVIVGSLAVVGWQVYEFIKDLVSPPLFRLVIQTGSGAYTAVASPNRLVITDLADKIAEAIDNPHVSYAVKIDTVNVGDNYTVSGSDPTMNIHHH